MNKKSILCLAVSAALLAGSSVPATAADASSVATKHALQVQLFNDADLNHDGKVTAQEFADYVLTLVFYTYDSKNSGKISRTEYVAWSRALRQLPRTRNGKSWIQMAWVTSRWPII